MSQGLRPLHAEEEDRMHDKRTCPITKQEVEYIAEKIGEIIEDNFEK